MPITSPHNDKLKTVRKLRARRRERERLGLFVAEGEDLLSAADAAGWEPVERFAATGSGLPGIEVEPELLAGVSELASGTRTLAIYRERWQAVGKLAPARLCVYLHGVQDPGNLGTVLRSAAAFGAARVVLGPGSADPFSPRAVRASMGAIFAVPVARAQSGQLRGVSVALHAQAERTLADLAEDLGQRAEVSLLIGAERDGLPADVLAGADHLARIPIVTESLNAAMAAAVGLYELTRRITPA
ncbi:MAG: TrmH family RNA methyltransferase [Solirubrobacteraceae bacterium]